MRDKRKLFLTSSGLTEPMISMFTRIIGKKTKDMKILYIPTAGIETDAAREGISICLYELLRMGIRSENILIYNLELILSKGYERTYSAYIKEGHIAGRLMQLEELEKFDSVFVGGGDCAVLCREMTRTGFDTILEKAINNGLVYVGISAGSMYAASNMENGLHIIPNSILPHYMGQDNFSLKDKEIRLVNGSAVYIDGIDVSLI